MSTTAQTATDIRPFHVEFPEEALGELRDRIAGARWPSEELVADRSQGVQLKTLQELASYWENEYDWRKAVVRTPAVGSQGNAPRQRKRSVVKCPCAGPRRSEARRSRIGG